MYHHITAQLICIFKYLLLYIKHMRIKQLKKTVGFTDFSITLMLHLPDNSCLIFLDALSLKRVAM